MDIENTVWKSADELCGEQPHIAGQTDERDIALNYFTNHQLFMLMAREAAVRDDNYFIAPRACQRNTGSIFTITDYNRDLGIEPASIDGIHQRHHIRATPGDKNGNLSVHGAIPAARCTR